MLVHLDLKQTRPTSLNGLSGKLWPSFDQKISLNIAFDVIMKHMKLLLFTNGMRDKKKLRERERKWEKSILYEAHSWNICASVGKQQLICLLSRPHFSYGTFHTLIMRAHRLTATHHLFNTPWLLFPFPAKESALLHIKAWYWFSCSPPALWNKTLTEDYGT